jgi:hypothetical protein
MQPFRFSKGLFFNENISRNDAKEESRGYISNAMPLNDAAFVLALQAISIFHLASLF